MGLALEVGCLAGLIELDEEGADWFREDMERLNRCLQQNGLEPHTEPEQCEAWSCDMFGYSGLHYLRRIAAHWDIHGRLPTPGDDDASSDPVLADYYALIGKSKPGLLSRLTRRRSIQRSFDHLIVHSDAEGYYIPQDFPEVLFPPDELEIPGGMVGSVQRLQEECRQLARNIELPLDLDFESDMVCVAMESQGQGVQQWEKYGVESYTCLALSNACAHALAHHAVIVFC